MPRVRLPPPCTILSAALCHVHSRWPCRRARPFSYQLLFGFWVILMASAALSLHCLPPRLLSSHACVAPDGLGAGCKIVPPISPPLSLLPLLSLQLREGHTAPPDYLTEAELIALMEKHGIGTDASIPMHINNIITRNYVRVQVRIAATQGGRSIRRAVTLCGAIVSIRLSSAARRDIQGSSCGLHGALFAAVMGKAR